MKSYQPPIEGTHGFKSPRRLCVVFFVFFRFRWSFFFFSSSSFSSLTDLSLCPYRLLAHLLLHFRKLISRNTVEDETSFSRTGVGLALLQPNEDDPTNKNNNNKDGDGKSRGRFRSRSLGSNNSTPTASAVVMTPKSLAEMKEEMDRRNKVFEMMLKNARSLLPTEVVKKLEAEDNRQRIKE